jgi:hypothetical protein
MPGRPKEYASRGSQRRSPDLAALASSVAGAAPPISQSDPSGVEIGHAGVVTALTTVTLSRSTPAPTEAR